jgi:hypothetical protein
MECVGYKGKWGERVVRNFGKTARWIVYSKYGKGGIEECCLEECIERCCGLNFMMRDPKTAVFAERNLGKVVLGDAFEGIVEIKDYVPTDCMVEEILTVVQHAVKPLISLCKNKNEVQKPRIYGKTLREVIKEFNDTSVSKPPGIHIFACVYYALYYRVRMTALTNGSTLYCCIPRDLPLLPLIESCDLHYPTIAAGFRAMCVSNLKEIEAELARADELRSKGRWGEMLLAFERSNRVIATSSSSQILVDTDVLLPHDVTQKGRAVSKAILHAMWDKTNLTNGSIASDVFFASRVGSEDSMDCVAVNALISQECDGLTPRTALDANIIVEDPLVLLRANTRCVWGKPGLLSIWLFLLERFVKRNDCAVSQRVAAITANTNADTTTTTTTATTGDDFLMIRDVVLMKCLLSAIEKHPTTNATAIMRSTMSNRPGLLAVLLPRLSPAQANLLFDAVPECSSDDNTKSIISVLSTTTPKLDKLLFLVTCGLKMITKSANANNNGLEGSRKRLAEIACNVLYNSVEELVKGSGDASADDSARSAAARLLDAMCSDDVLCSGRELWSMIVRSLAKIVQACVAMKKHHAEQQQDAAASSGSNGNVNSAVVQRMISRFSDMVKKTIRGLGVQV